MSGAKTYLARTWSGVLLFAIQSQHFLLFAGRLHFSAAAFFLQHSGTGEQLGAFGCAQQTRAAHSETQTPLAMLEAVRDSVKTKLMSSLIPRMIMSLRDEFTNRFVICNGGDIAGKKTKVRRPMVKRFPPYRRRAPAL